MAKNKLINLLPQEEFDSSIMGRVLKWAMGTFRIIVIVTEMIVMGAFLSRFWLDAQNSDLDDEIRIKNAQISAQSDFEKEFRAVQSKLKIIKALSTEKKPSEKISLITSRVPGDVILSSISMESASSQIKGVGNSEVGIAQLIVNLQNEPLFKTVELTSLNSSEDNPALSNFTVKVFY